MICLLREMSRKRRLFCLTVEQKREICVFHDQNPSKTQKEIADIFTRRFGQPVSRRTVGDILSGKPKWLANQSRDAKRLRQGKHAELEDALHLWFASASAQNVVVTDAALRDTARQIGAELGVDDFQYSNGWLHRFKTRHRIASQRATSKSREVLASQRLVCGEQPVEHGQDIPGDNHIGVDPSAVSITWRGVPGRWLNGYPCRDIYFLVATGLFYRLMPDRSLTTPDPSKGLDKPMKDRVSVVLCANAEGSEKLKPLIIGTVQDPPCLRGRLKSELCIEYRANQNALLGASLLRDFLQAFDRRMARENRRILLLLEDHTPINITHTDLSHVRCLFLPPSATCHERQPVGAVMAQAFKSHYRRLVMQFLVAEVEAGRPLPLVELSDALRWSQLSWDHVTAEVIAAFWHQVKLVPGDLQSSPVAADIVKPSGAACDLHDLLQRLGHATNIPPSHLMTPDEYLAVDNWLPTCELTSDAQPLALANSQKTGETSGGEEEKRDDLFGIASASTPSKRADVSHEEAAKALDVLMRFFEQTPLARPDDIRALSVIKCRVDHLCQ
ncbi:tigger transposable element-derived protein 4-like [Pomacea canaliculata]|nr:tigger transposable element-derived protein 4-like [Pomacea canaliculata]